MIFNIFNSLVVFAAIEAHSIDNYYSNFVWNHDQFNAWEVNRLTEGMTEVTGWLPACRWQYKQNRMQLEMAISNILKNLRDSKLTEKSRRFRIRLNLPSKSF